MDDSLSSNDGGGTYPASRAAILPYLLAAGRLRYLSKLPNSDEMKTVKITEPLEYYDGILAFAAQDPIGGNYVGSMIERTR